jgi:hypothetical protein
MNKVILTLVSTVIMVANLTAQVNLGSGLVAKYTFVGNANDVSGNGYTGTVNGATLTNDRFGNSSSAYSFTSSNYIDCQTGGLPSDPTSITQCAWIKTTSSGMNMIMTRRQSDGDGWPSLFINGGYPVISMDKSGSRNDYSVNLNVADGFWHFIVGVKDNSTYKLYIDGLLMKTAVDGSTLSSTSNLHIGHHGSWNNWFDGAIDDVSLYNRGLSGEEINLLYHNGLYIKSPLKNTDWFINSSQTITWQWASNVSTIDIKYSSDSCKTWQTLASDYGVSLGSFSWTAPAVKNNYCYLKITDHSNNEIVDSIHFRVIDNDFEHSMVASYPFSGNPIDVSGNENNGTISNASLTTDRFNRTNNAYFFDYNLSALISSPASDNWAFTGTNFTISMWFTINDISRQNDGLIGRDNYQWLSVVYNYSGNSKINIWFDENGSSDWEYTWILDKTDWKNNSWYNLTIERNYSSFKAYINGILINTFYIDKSINNPISTPLFMGRGQTSGFKHDGKLDDVLIFNRALTENEVQ